MASKIFRISRMSAGRNVPSTLMTSMDTITAAPVAKNHTVETMSLLQMCWWTDTGRVNIK